MPKKILFVFEGERIEEQIISNLQKFFVNENTIITSVYGAEIYQIYKEVVADEDLDTFNLIKDRNTKNNAILSSYSRDDFGEIYMFFDYDGHSSPADDNKLKELLEFFKEETEKGKLYISYPMAESLKHVCDYESFGDLKVECKQNINYKNIVHNSAIKELIQFNKYDIEIWKSLINIHLKKMNYVVVGSFELPNNIITQLILFSNQLEKYINIDSTVAVLSAFPVFIHDYYGNDETKKRIAPCCLEY